MKHIVKRLALAVSFSALSLVASAGCGDRKAGAAMNAQLEVLAEKVCACTTAECADKVVDEVVELAKKNASASGDEDKARKSGEKIGKCAIQAGMDQAKFMAKISSIGK
jgi:Cdc6-like AAA superfamily ATPase